jgi:hypothetical protein
MTKHQENKKRDGQKSPTEEAVIEAAKNPGFGTILHVIYRVAGWKGIVIAVTSFAVGLIAAGFLVYKGLAPESLINEGYQKASEETAKTPPKGRKTITGLTNGNVLDNPMELVDAYVYRLNHEGQIQKDMTPEMRYGVGAVEYPINQSVLKFSLSLQANPNYQITGRAYKYSPRDGTVKPLDFRVIRDSAQIEFAVPECEDGDKLIIVVRAVWVISAPLADIRDSYRLSVRADA